MSKLHSLTTRPVLILYLSVLVVLTIFIALFVSAEVLVPEVASSKTLGAVFGGKNIDYDRSYAQEYLALYNNFSDVKFKRVWGNDAATFTMGNKQDSIKGFRTEKGKFAIHLVYCDEFQGFCKFRINGVPTLKMSTGGNDFDVDETHVLRIKDMKFNQCDNHRFCHLGYEGYHTIDIVIAEK